MDLFLFSKILRPFLTFSNLFIILIIFLFFFKKKKYYLNYFFKFIIFLYLTIGILPIGNLLNYHLLEKDYFNKDNSEDFDSILVLSGNVSRYLKAVNLQRKNIESKLIFTGGSGLIVSKNGNNEVKQFEFLVSNVVDKDSIIILENSRNTIENLKNFKNAKFGLKKTILVTEPFHYKRSLLIAKKLDLNLEPYYHKTFFNNSILNQYQNYSFSKNWENFDIFMFELLGILRVFLLKI